MLLLVFFAIIIMILRGGGGGGGGGGGAAPLIILEKTCMAKYEPDDYSKYIMSYNYIPTAAHYVKEEYNILHL